MRANQVQTANPSDCNVTRHPSLHGATSCSGCRNAQIVWLDWSICYSPVCNVLDSAMTMHWSLSVWYGMKSNCPAQWQRNPSIRNYQSEKLKSFTRSRAIRRSAKGQRNVSFGERARLLFVALVTIATSARFSRVSSVNMKFWRPYPCAMNQFTWLIKDRDRS